MEELDYTDGQYVVQMGETADALYFVKEGEVVCHQRDKGSDKSADLMRLKKGGVFDDDQIDGYIDLKMEENMKYELHPHPVEFDMYYKY